MRNFSYKFAVHFIFLSFLRLFCSPLHFSAYSTILNSHSMEFKNINVNITLINIVLKSEVW